MNKERRFYTFYTAIGIILLLLAIFGPYLFSKISLGPEFNENTGYIGDTIGGITAPFINLLAALLVWISFREQVKANKLLSKETSYSFINSLVSNFKTNFERDITEYDNVFKRLYNFNFALEIQNIKITQINYDKIYNEEDIPEVIKKSLDELFKSCNSFLINVSGTSNSLTTIINNIELSNLDKNIKHSLLENIKPEYRKLQKYNNNCLKVIKFLEENLKLSGFTKAHISELSYKREPLNSSIAKYRFFNLRLFSKKKITEKYI